MDQNKFTIKDCYCTLQEYNNDNDTLVIPRFNNVTHLRVFNCTINKLIVPDGYTNVYCVDNIIKTVIFSSSETFIFLKGSGIEHLQLNEGNENVTIINNNIKTVTIPSTVTTLYLLDNPYLTEVKFSPRNNTCYVYTNTPEKFNFPDFVTIGYIKSRFDHINIIL